jgi:hypothetical protein
MNDSKNILTSKTAWTFAILLAIGALKALGIVDFEIADNEVEGIVLALMALIGIALRLISDKPVHIL